jgi:hypothetical protein
MGYFDYNSQRSDLESKYSQDRAVQDYGRMLGQRNFKTTREDMVRKNALQFPKLTSAFARRFGSKVQSGRVGADMSQYMNDYNRGLAGVDEQQASFEGAQNLQAANTTSAYQQALMRLMEQLKAQQAGQDPFAVYTNVWGN